MLRVESLKLLNNRIVDFSIHKNEGILLSGDNGSGKSLFLKSLARLSPASYQSFFYKEKSIEEWDPEIYRSEVMYLSASSFYTKDMTVNEFFSAPLSFSIYKNYQSDFDYKAVLESWKIPNRGFSHLSTGQRQMVSILRALTLKPSLLLLDEPTANLDQEKTRAVEELILRWKEKSGNSVIWISHSPDQSERLGFHSLHFNSPM